MAQPTPRGPSDSTHTTTVTTQEQIQQKFDLSIALRLSTWPALTLAVQNSWGGPDSSEKRDWLAGAISDLFASPDTAADIDGPYLEEFVLQVLNDEFDVNVQDGSAEEVAEDILRLRKETLRGEFWRVEEMMGKWEEGRRRGGVEKVGFVQGRDEEGETDWDSEEDGGEDEQEGEDVEMGEAPALVRAPREKRAPEVDEEGFTKIVGRTKR